MKPQITSRLDEDDAQAIALDALMFLTSDMDRLGGFLAASGIAPTAIRDEAENRSFQAGVLAHLLQNESLMLVFAGARQLAPEMITAAHTRLAGPAGDPGSV